MTQPNVTLGLVNIAIALLVTALAIPLILGRIRMNRWYGIRIAKAFESAELWYRINRVGGKLLIFYSIVLVAIGLIVSFSPKLDSSTGILVANAPLIYLATLVHIHLATRKF